MYYTSYNNTTSPEFWEHYETWWDTLKKLFPGYFLMDYANRMACKEQVDALVGAL